MNGNHSKSMYLVRHAESQMNTNPDLIGGRSNESPLTSRGLEQANNLGRFLLKLEIVPDIVFASPAIRTQQTAEHSLTQMGLSLPIEIADEIQELAQGEVEGRKRSDIYTPEAVDEINRRGKDFRQPGGESMNDVGLRMHNWVNETVAKMAETEDRRTALVFTHGGAITYLVSRLQDWSHPETYAFQKTVANTSVTRLDVHDGEIEMGFINRKPVES